MADKPNPQRPSPPGGTPKPGQSQPTTPKK
jgi:hypothetical protein